MSAILEKIDSLIDSYQGEMLQTLRRWVAVPSVGGGAPAEGAPFGVEPRRALDTALADAAAMGFETDLVDGYAGAIQLGSGKRTMGMLCHLDVVPAGDGWTFPPFELSLHEGKVIGRGVNDDKGPAIAALFAMRAVRESGLPLHDAVRLVLGCDEETGMKDMRYYASHRKMPDYGFSPDAEFPVINIEKAGMSVRLSKRTGGEEGAEIPVYSLYAGEAANVVPGKATAVVGTKNVSFEELSARCAKLCEDGMTKLEVTKLDDDRAQILAIGVSAHASLPHLGVNAAGMLLMALSSLNAGGGSAGMIRLLAEKIGLDGTGKGLGIAVADEESGALTCNLGLMRYDGDEMWVVLDNRVPICGDIPSLLGAITYTMSAERIAVTCMGHHAPHHVPADSEIVQKLLAAYHEVSGLPAYAFAIGGGTYSRMMPNTVAFGFNFPGDPDPCHMPDEAVDWTKFVLSTKIFAHAIARLAGTVED